MRRLRKRHATLTKKRWDDQGSLKEMRLLFMLLLLPLHCRLPPHHHQVLSSDRVLPPLSPSSSFITLLPSISSYQLQSSVVLTKSVTH